MTRTRQLDLQLQLRKTFNLTSKFIRHILKCFYESVRSSILIGVEINCVGYLSDKDGDLFFVGIVYLFHTCNEFINCIACDGKVIAFYEF